MVLLPCWAPMHLRARIFKMAYNGLNVNLLHCEDNKHGVTSGTKRFSKQGVIGNRKWGELGVQIHNNYIQLTDWPVTPLALRGRVLALPLTSGQGRARPTRS